ncbi:uncharacterized membrane protein isoform X2, partial [Tanacetum coccineum]
AEKDIDGDTKVEDVPDSLMGNDNCRDIGISERAARTDGGDPFMDFGGWWYVIAIIISSFSLALYCATVVHQGGLLKFGLAYVLAVTSLFDEYTNDILLTEEPWFPRYHIHFTICGYDFQEDRSRKENDYGRHD